MRIEDLRYLIEVAKRNSISQAADACYISQQGMSRVISNLEKELHVKLYYRTNNGIRMTAAGDMVVQRALEMDTVYQKMLGDIGSFLTPESIDNDYCIYTTEPVAETFLPPIVDALNVRYPGMKIRIMELPPMVIADEADFSKNYMGIISIADFLERDSKRLQDKTLTFQQFYQDELMVSVGRNSPYATRTKLDPEELATLPMALFNTEMNMVRYLMPDGVKPILAMNVSNYDMCLEMVVHNHAVGLTSAVRQYYRKPGATIAVPLEKTVKIHYGCIYDSAFADSPFTKELTGMVETELKKLENHF